MILFILSLAIVALGQPAWVAPLGPLSACIGYVLFWKFLERFEGRGNRFWVGATWYAIVQMVQLSWMTSIEYQGIYILFAYIGLCLWLGCQFGCLSLCVPKRGALSPLSILALASFWTLIEWGRLYVLCGFSWNLSGIALASYTAPMQLAAVWGVLGLSFWVILVNLWGLKAFFSKKKIQDYSLWITLALFPYLFGWGHLAYHDHGQEGEKLSIALVQTGLSPAQKIPLKGHGPSFIFPFEQWVTIVRNLKNEKKKVFDLIILPESVVPLTARDPFYPLEDVINFFLEEFGENVLSQFPRLQSPFAEKRQGVWRASNLFWVQTLANLFSAEVIAGLDDEDKILKENYQAAFHCLPRNEKMRRYEKRVLVPLAEYLPFPWLRPFTKSYGIFEFFTPGKEAKIFQGIIPLSISICYEETFPDLIREGPLQGAKLLVNVTNDNWYPHSRLSKQHFDHGKMRAIENGTAVLRACNTGITAGIDSLGRVISSLGKRETAGVLAFSLSPHHFPTLYTRWGDGGIIALSLIFLGFFLRFRKGIN